MKFAALVFTALVSTLASNAQAAIVTVGSLTRDTEQSTITDTLNNRTWLGWDVTKGLTYAQTVAATGSGGLFAGYSMAHNVDAQMLINAFLPLSPCNDTNNTICIYGQTRDLELIVGESSVDYRAIGESFDFDLAFFLSDNGLSSQVGIIEIFTKDASDIVRQSFVAKSNEWMPIDFADSYNPSTVGWMLYRDSSNSVPEPSGLALLGLAGVALGWSQRRRRLTATKSTQ